LLRRVSINPEESGDMEKSRDMERKVRAGGSIRHCAMSRASLCPAGIIAPAAFCAGAIAA